MMDKNSILSANIDLANQLVERELADEEVATAEAIKELLFSPPKDFTLERTRAMAFFLCTN